jgi:hypothetical protein
LSHKTPSQIDDRVKILNIGESGRVQEAEKARTCVAFHRLSSMLAVHLSGGLVV